MENLVWVVYFISKLNLLLVFLWLGALLLVITAVIGRLALNDARTLNRDVLYWEAFGFKRWVIPASFLFMLVLVVPNESSALRLLAVYGGVEVLQNKEMQEVGNKGFEVLNKVMDEYLEKPSVNN